MVAAKQASELGAWTDARPKPAIDMMDLRRRTDDQRVPDAIPEAIRITCSVRATVKLTAGSSGWKQSYNASIYGLGFLHPPAGSL